MCRKNLKKGKIIENATRRITGGSSSAPRRCAAFKMGYDVPPSGGTKRSCGKSP